MLGICGAGILQGVGHQLEEQDLARMAAQVEKLRRKNAALSLVANTGHPAPVSALTSQVVFQQRGSF